MQRVVILAPVRKKIRFFSLFLALNAVADAQTPVSPLSEFDLKDELFVSTSGCEVLPEHPEDDPFCDVVALGQEGDWKCTGLDLGEGWILTARHCLPLSEVAWGHDTARPLASSPIAEVVLAPDARLDVVLLRTQTPLEIAPHPRRTHSALQPPLGQLRAVGFGSDLPSGVSIVRRKRGVYLHSSPDWGCDIVRSAVTGCHPNLEMIATGHGAKDTCHGDSGGPLFEQVGSEWRLIGVVSRPIRNSLALCGDGGIYTRVSQLAPWIGSVLAKTKEEPHVELDSLDRTPAGHSRPR